MKQADAVDRQIMSVLQRDGRASNVAIAREIGVSEGTVRRRIDALVSADVVRIVAIINPYSIGLNTLVLMHLNVEPQRLGEVAEQLMDMSEVRYVSFTTGEHDILLEAMFPSNTELLLFIRDRISLLPGVIAFKTDIELQILKRSYDWRIAGEVPLDVCDASPHPDRGGDESKVWSSGK